ncbi:hypothetical protein LAZ67_10000711 [Cordylochernes scorpioides]|uniref:Uncharacterized protein n=1 Tax=Cordylochernes scorpioides TaxID=51811 RepID=A0ABY6KWY1_9ARAC|nr:hypothetical protein LAZ67_10000711 [Cordylochernes scorpioides]
MVEREWRAIPQDAIRTLIDSLPRRVAACIAVRGCTDRSDLLHGQDTTTSVGRYSDQGARTELIYSMDKISPLPQLAGIVIGVHGPIRLTPWTRPHHHFSWPVFINTILSTGQWIGRRGPIEFPARSPDLTPLDFFLWGTVKDGVYKRKPRNLDILWNEIQAVCREISVDVLIRCTESVVTRTQKQNSKCVYIFLKHPVYR